MRFFTLLLSALGIIQSTALATGNTTEIVKGLSWFGLETEYRGLMCTWAHDIRWHLDNINKLGFNSIRLPFAYQYITEGNWSVMDSFFHEITNYNISVILDFHRIENTHQSAKPYSEGVTFDQVLSAWKTILTRYESNYNLVGIDIWNEYQLSNSAEWNSLARQMVSYIESKFPERLVYYVQGTNWGGNIHFTDLSDLPYWDRIIYTAHKYVFSDAEPLEDHWEWSISSTHNVTRINIGETGFISTVAHEFAWMERFIKWLKNKNIRNSFWWTYSFNSIDTGGVLKNDCETNDMIKMNMLYEYWD